MMYDVMMAGFGGQGVLLMGDLLAYAAMREGKEVTWMPSYGVEMRGGAANCTVIISDKKIGSPLSEDPAALVAMSNPGLLKFEGRVRSGGLLVVNTSLVDQNNIKRKDLNIIAIAANEMAARDLGDQRNANMIILGAFAAKSGAVPFDKLLEAVPAFLPAHRTALVDVMVRGLERGRKFVEEESA
jgi:2-oxoglutarate ferredoxin oxidoreductase subunit gamma